MSVKFGNIAIGDIPLGGVAIGKAYLGDVLVFRKGIQPVEPYLEISPQIIWVYPDLETDNDVYSNTTWNVN